MNTQQLENSLAKIVRCRAGPVKFKTFVGAIDQLNEIDLNSNLTKFPLYAIVNTDYIKDRKFSFDK